MAPLAKSAILLSRSGLCGQQTLNDGLVGAVARHREESASDYSRPECISFCGIHQAEGEIERLKFIRRSRRVHDRVPSSRNPVEQQKERGDRSGEIQDELATTSVQITAFMPPSKVYTSTSPMIRRTEVRCSVPNAAFTTSAMARCAHLPQERE